MSTNKARAERAEQTLQTYVEAKGEVFDRSSDEVCDLIADLLHFTSLLHAEDPDHRDIDQMMTMAQMHFDAEINDPDEGQAP